MRNFGRWFTNKKSQKREVGGVRRSGTDGKGARKQHGRIRAVSESGASNSFEYAISPRRIRVMSAGTADDDDEITLSSIQADPTKRVTSVSVGQGEGDKKITSISDLLTPPEDRGINTEDHAANRQGHTYADGSANFVASVIESINGDDSMVLTDFIREHGGRGALCNHRDSELFSALVLKGVHDHERGELWLSASGGKKRMLENEPGHYARIKISSKLGCDDEKTLAAIRQIDLDLGRTKGLQQQQQSNDNTNGDDGFASTVSLETLRSILIATSRELPHIGYCQSMNFLGAMLLEHLDEEEAFWVLVSLADDMLRGYYTLSLIGCRVDQRVFAELVDIVMPEVSRQVDDIMGLPSVGILSYHWFLTVFLTTIEDHEALLRIWDVFFARGPRALFQISLSVFEKASSAIIAAEEIQDISIAIADALHSYSIVDLNKAILGMYGNVATSKKIDELRLKHLSVLKEEEGEMQRKLAGIKNANAGSEGSRPGSMRRLASLSNIKKSNQSAMPRAKVQNNKRASLMSEMLMPVVNQQSLDGSLKDCDTNEVSDDNLEDDDLIEDGVDTWINTSDPMSHPETSSVKSSAPREPRFDASSRLSLDDLVEIERVVLEEMRRLLGIEMNGTKIDGRRLCRADRDTFLQVWATACRASSKIQSWAQNHISEPSEIFDAFGSSFSQDSLLSSSRKLQASDVPDNRNVVEMVDFRELLCGLSVLCVGDSREAKLGFIYQIYDTDRNQTLDADELHDMMHAVYSMFLSSEDGEDLVERQVDGFVRLVFAKLLHSGGSGNNVEGKTEMEAGLSFAQFREVSVMQPLILQYLMSNDIDSVDGDRRKRGSRGSRSVSQIVASASSEFADSAKSHTEATSTSNLPGVPIKRIDSVDLHKSSVLARVNRNAQRSENESSLHARNSESGTVPHQSLLKYNFVNTMEKNMRKTGKIPAHMARDWKAFMQGISQQLVTSELLKLELAREKRIHDALDLELEETEQRLEALKNELSMEKQKNQMNQHLLRKLADSAGT